MLPLICEILTLKSSHSLFNNISQDSNTIVAKPWFLNWGGISINSRLAVWVLHVILEINNSLEYILNIIPEIKPMIGFDHKHPHHHLDVFNHTLYAISLSKKDF